MLKDNFGRVITNLRISITNRCNLNCLYCHREGETNPSKDISADRIIEIAEAFHTLGVKKLKITGGEPLLRRDLFDILVEMPSFQEISMTTNGTFLSEKAYELKECGLDRVNISLDTLDPDKYRYITGGGRIEKVLAGIETAYNAQLTPIKVNTVVMKGINETEIDELLAFTNLFNDKNIQVILQLIELIPITPMLRRYYYDISKLESKYAKIATGVNVRAMHKRRQYITPLGVVEIVKPIDNIEFCLNCNRIRVTSDGKLKLCLLGNKIVDINGLHGTALIDTIKRAVKLREPFFPKMNNFI